ncbi:MAG: TRAP transporter substrate-binding protein [Clostridiales bacterium]|nr:TRAP transporter substrate-binding protein [Clostridiales bacterium]
MKKSIALLLAAALSATALSGCGSSSASSPETTAATQAAAETKATEEAKSEAPAEVLKITVGSTGSKGLAGNDAWTWAWEEIEKRSNGHLVFESLNDSQLGNDESLLTQAMDGVLDVVGTGTSVYGKYTPLLDGIQLPFLIDSYEKEYAMFTSPEMDAIKEQIASDLGLRIMGLGESGIRHFATVGKEINTPEDLKGLKMRVVPGTVTADAMALLGASPTTIAYNEIYTSLQNKIIDSEEVNYSTINNQKHYEVITNVSEIGMYPFPSVVTFSEKFWQSLSAEDQQLISEVFAEAEKKCFEEYIVEYENAARKACEENGVVINVIEDKEPFRAITQELYKTYTDKDPLVAAFVEAALKLE